jgi:hypothetical protein
MTKTEELEALKLEYARLCEENMRLKERVKAAEIRAPIPSKRRPDPRSKTVLCIDPDTGEILREFPSLSAAANSFENISSAYQLISKACQGRAKSAYGWHWKFKSDQP